MWGNKSFSWGLNLVVVLLLLPSINSGNISKTFEGLVWNNGISLQKKNYVPTCEQNEKCHIASYCPVSVNHWGGYVAFLSAATCSWAWGLKEAKQKTLREMLYMQHLVVLLVLKGCTQSTQVKGTSEFTSFQKMRLILHATKNDWAHMWIMYQLKQQLIDVLYKHHYLVGYIIENHTIWDVLK